MHSTANIYSDLDVDKLETLPPSQPHRAVDLAIIEADTQGKSPPAPHSLMLNNHLCMIGYVKTYIVLPGPIWGIASGPLVDLGLQKSQSVLIPTLVKIGINRGQGGVIGLGKNIWSYVHISDSGCSRLLCNQSIPSTNPSLLSSCRSLYPPFGTNSFRQTSRAWAERSLLCRKRRLSRLRPL